MKIVIYKKRTAVLRSFALHALFVLMLYLIYSYVFSNGSYLKEVSAANSAVQNPAKSGASSNQSSFSKAELSPFGHCADARRCALHEREASARSAPMLEQLRPLLHDLRLGKLDAVHSAHQVMTLCNHDYVSDRVSDEILGFGFAKQVSEGCGASELANVIQEFDGEFQRQLAAIPAAADRLEPRLRYMESKAQLLDGLDNREGLNIKMLADGLLIEQRNAPAAKKSALWHEIYMLADKHQSANAYAASLAQSMNQYKKDH